jgi:hypothetical protein
MNANSSLGYEHPIFIKVFGLANRAVFMNLNPKLTKDFTFFFVNINEG